MEFKYRAVDNTPPPTSHPLSTIAYFSDRSLRGCFSGNVPATKIFRMPVVGNASEALRRELEKEQIRREIEKEEIRREIIVGEIARRRELEEEVRRELALERGLGIPMQRNFLFQEHVSMCLNPRLNPVDTISGESQPQLPQLVAPPQIKSSPQNKKDKVIILAKPDPDSHGAKRKVITPLAVYGREHSPFGLQKKPKEEWSCALCKVSATSENGLNDHLNGRKHKAKEAALRTPKIGLDLKADLQSLQPCITSADINHTTVDEGVIESKNEEHSAQKSQDIGGLGNENETATSKQSGKVNALTRKKLEFWCEICHIYTRSEIVMQGHKNGKKHLMRIKKFRQNNGSAPSTSSVSLEDTGLIKDTDAVNKEIDQKMTSVLNEETIPKTAERYSDEVHPVAEPKGDRGGEEL